MYEHNTVDEAEKIIADFGVGIIAWYPFKKDTRLLLVGHNDVRIEYLNGICREVVCADIGDLTREFLDNNKYSFDYVLIISVIENAKEPEELLSKCRELIRSGGKLLVATDNRFGLRFFCGDSDPYTGRNNDGIEGYRRIRREAFGNLKGRLFNKAELEAMLDSAGFLNRKFYAVLPNVSMPSNIYSEDSLPKRPMQLEEIQIRYDSPDLIHMEEIRMYDDLIKSGMFMDMANAFFIECVVGEAEFCNIKRARMDLTRWREGLVVETHTSDSDGYAASLRAPFAEGADEIYSAMETGGYLSERGVDVISFDQKDDDSLTYSISEGKYGYEYLQELLESSVDEFYGELDRIRDILVDKLETYEDDGGKLFVKKCPLELDLRHCHYVDGDYVFFDQRHLVSDVRFDALWYRFIGSVSILDRELGSKLVDDPVVYHYGFMDNGEVNLMMRPIGEFYGRLSHGHALSIYNKETGYKPDAVFMNRVRMAYPQARYNKIFEDIFAGTENKDIVLFGSGNYAKLFMEYYGSSLDVKAIIDNKDSSWGSDVDGVPVIAPSEVGNMDLEKVKVIVCVRNFDGILEQLEGLGVKDYSVYDPNMTYPRAGSVVVKAAGGEVVKKAYHIGYVAGVFDLFHLGHVNLLRRAKEQCDYLIVGVVSDEGVIHDKKTDPYMSCDERMAIVGACRYVDEVHEIPFKHALIQDAYKMYHFDAMFSGNDYEGDTGWLSEKEYLEEHGARLVFFPYTKEVSTTKLKGKIGNK